MSAFTIDASVWVAALEHRDHFHEPSVALLRELESTRARLWAPSLVLLEVSCALARRTREATIGDAAASRLRSHPLLSLRALDAELLDVARSIGTQRYLRAADALYLATATLEAAALVTWDAELLARGDAVTPTQALQSMN